MGNAATPEVAQTTQGNTAFGLELYGRLGQAHGSGNLFLSPYSISSALGMTAQGARNKTAEQMVKVLHLPGNQGMAGGNHAGVDLSMYQAAMGNINGQLLGGDGKRAFELSVSNNLWVDQTFPLLGSFVSDSQKFFQAGVVNVDFVKNSDGARQQINEAVAAQTHEKIKDLLPAGSVDRSTALVLTNAIYFKGTWETPFAKSSTTDQPFHVDGKKDVTVAMMKSPNSASYGFTETDEAQVLSLPYKGTENAPAGRSGRGTAGGGNMLSMVIVLPKKVDGLAEVEKEVVAGNVDKWTGSLRRQAVQVFVPRFKMTTQFELSSELKGMGMTEAFSPAADFSGISGSAEGKLFISAVLHKAFVEVNEEGTEAAAATGVVMSRSAMMANPTVFRADHPFLFLIRHEATGAILFMGRVSEPK
ncbi:MAG TPA: serpin family protein, partial [Phycisphaerae bacterium]